MATSADDTCGIGNVMINSITKDAAIIANGGPVEDGVEANYKFGVGCVSIY